MSEVEEMIRELTIACEEVLGVKMTDEQRVQVQQRVIQHFGGERVYVPKRAPFEIGRLSSVRDLMELGMSRASAYRRSRKK